MVTQCHGAPREARPAEVKKVEAALPDAARVKPAKPRKVLIFNLCRGFRHGSIPIGAKAFELMGKKTGAYESVSTDDVSWFEPDKLKQFDAVIINNCTGSLFKGDAAREARLKKSLLDFVTSGGGLVGVHAATDAFYKWPEYGEMMGGYFWGHPWHEKVTVKMDDPDHALSKAVGQKTFQIADEIYQIRDPYSRQKLRILMSIDVTKTNMNKKSIRRKDNDFGVSWIRSYGKGRVFYCSLGHRNEIFWNPMILKYYLDGIQFAIGDLKADTTPSAKSPKAPAATPAPAPAKAEIADPITGEYVGTLTVGGKDVKGIAQVIAEGDKRYRAVLMNWRYGGPKKDEKDIRIELTGKAKDTSVSLAGKAGNVQWTGSLVGRTSLSARSADGKCKFEGRFTVRTSSTLGAKPPAGAVVLLAFEPPKPPKLDEWTNKRWKPLKTGAVEVSRGNTFSVKSFGSARMHVEFRCPFEPSKRGQGRGNSGVYIQKRYEVQVLDSFGLVSRKGDAGAIYGVAIPRINASLPPTMWQTYDIEFVAAKFDRDKKLIRKPTMTVYHNGIKIHENVELPSHTRAAGASGFTATAPIMLQDHGNKVQYRNIWVLEAKE